MTGVVVAAFWGTPDQGSRNRRVSRNPCWLGDREMDATFVFQSKVITETAYGYYIILDYSTYVHHCTHIN